MGSRLVACLLPALVALALLLALPLAEAPLRLGAAVADSDDDDDGKGRGRGHEKGHKGHGHKHHGGDDDDDDDNDDDDRQGQNAPPSPGLEMLVATTATGDAERIAAAGFVILARDSLGLIGGELLRLRAPAGLGPEQARVTLTALAPGATIDVNGLYRPEEFLCGEAGCAAFELVGWEAAAGACRLSPLLGMLDTTVNGDHPGLAGQALERVTLLADGRTPASAVHGTAIAALLIGAAESRTPGLLPEARLIAVEAFHRDAAGNAIADAFDLVRGLDLLGRRGVAVVNMSFAGPPNEVLRVALAVLERQGIGLVAAAGNGGPAAAPLFPGAYAGVLAVTAVDAELALFRQAGSGPHIAFAAPGVRLWTAASVSGGRFRSGTSYAVPFVTAALAAERLLHLGEPLALAVEALAGRARDLGAPGRDPLYGWGLLQNAAACAPG